MLTVSNNEIKLDSLASNSNKKKHKLYNNITVFFETTLSLLHRKDSYLKTMLSHRISKLMFAKQICLLACLIPRKTIGLPEGVSEQLRNSSWGVSITKFLLTVIYSLPIFSSFVLVFSTESLSYWFHNPRPGFFLKELGSLMYLPI